MSHPKMELNSITVTRRIKRWLEENFKDSAIKLEFDEKSLGTAKLHFVAYVDDDDNDTRCAPTPMPDAYQAMKEDLGVAFWCVNAPTQLDIYAEHPTDSDGNDLRSRFQRKSQQLMLSVWPWPFALLMIVASFISCSYFAYTLHVQWHDYEAPLDVLFHWIFQVAIYVGGRLFGGDDASRTLGGNDGGGAL